MDKRDSKGRFAKGWKGGPGRPARPVEERAVETFNKACQADDLAEIIAKLVADAKAGQTRAAEIVIRLALGTKTISEIEKEINARDSTALAQRSDEDMIRILVLDPRWRPLLKAELDKLESAERESVHEEEESEAEGSNGTEPGELN